MSQPVVPVSITLVIDRSGSMQSIKSDVIGGVNSFFNEQRKQPGQAVITYTQFDSVYEVVYAKKPLEEVEDLTDATFVPRGSTALYDAIGRTLSAIEAETEAPQIIVVMTDGEENASREFMHAQVKQQVEKAQAKGWQIIFMGANIDAAAVGGSMGIAASNINTYDATARGATSSMSAMSMKLDSMRTAYASADANWADAGGTMSDLYSKVLADTTAAKTP